MDTEAVSLARPYAGNTPVEDVGCALRQLDALLTSLIVEEAHFDGVGDLGGNGEICPVVSYRRTEGVGRSGFTIHSAPVCLRDRGDHRRSP